MAKPVSERRLRGTLDKVTATCMPIDIDAAVPALTILGGEWRRLMHRTECGAHGNPFSIAPVRYLFLFIYIYTHVYVSFMYVFFMYMCLYVYTFTYTCRCIYIYTYVYAKTCVYRYASVLASAGVYIYISIYI